MSAHAEYHTTNGTDPTISPNFATNELRPGNRVLALIVDCPLDVLRLGNDIRIINVSSFEVCENLIRLFDTALGYEPARRPQDSGSHGTVA